MELDIKDISLSDKFISQMIFNQQLRLLTITSNESLRVSDKKRFGKTKIIIDGWKELFVEKYVSESPEKGETFKIDWTVELETFELIQEIKFDNNENIFLAGWSKESGAWLTYNFKNGKFNIEVEVIK